MIIGLCLPCVGLSKLPCLMTNEPTCLPGVSRTAPFLAGGILHGGYANVVPFIAFI
jgi:hypothetical protein